MVGPHSSIERGGNQFRGASPENGKIDGRKNDIFIAYFLTCKYYFNIYYHALYSSACTDLFWCDFQHVETFPHIRLDSLFLSIWRIIYEDSSTHRESFHKYFLNQ